VRPRRRPLIGGLPQPARSIFRPDETIPETILPADETIFGSPRNRPETVAGQKSPQGSPKKATGELQMNHSIYSADRSTHRKIVIVALVAGIAVAGLGISVRSSSDEGTTQTARVLKAGKPVAITSSGASVVR
jgi:hypothetical protein